MKRTPGPLPSSCFTCRQRKKKCDKRQPACTACLDSGLKCLGYDQPFSTSSSIKSASSLRPLAPKIIQPGVLEVDRTTENHLAECDQPQTPPPNGDLRLRPSAIQPYHRTILPPPSTISHEPRLSSSTSPSHSEAQIQSQPSSLLPSRRGSLSLGLPCSPPPESELAGSTDSGKSSPRSHPFASGELAQSTRWSPWTSEGCFDLSVWFRLPPRICPDPVTSGKLIAFILAQYEPLLEFVFFKPTRACLDMARNRIITRLRSDSLTHLSMYIGARILQTLTKDGKFADLRYLNSCLRRLDQHICVSSVNTDSIGGLGPSLSGGLELVFLDFLTSNAQAGYSLLKNLVPTFLQLAFTDTDLCLRQLDPTSTGISFSHVIFSPVHEVRRFVFTDTTSAFIFGVPPLIEYDVSFPLINPRPPRLENEWDSGTVPESNPELTYLIAKVNVWRARNPGKPAPESEWKPLEARAWASELGTRRKSWRESEREGWEKVVTMAILEGWRHAVLIYVYMGMGGFASDDRRVQSSVRQIIQLLRVLRQDWTPRIHYSFPCLIAAICTPYEKHRAELSDTFLKVKDAQPWLFKSMDYKPVIEHLWHGAAANGRPVRWEDYVDSRRLMLPID